MTEYFCDSCGARVTKENSPNGKMGRLTRRKGNMTVEVLVARNGTWNAGEFCTRCIVETVVEGKNVNGLSIVDSL